MALLAHLLIVLILARALGGLAERMGHAPVVGELTAGIILSLIIAAAPDLPLIGDLADSHDIHITGQLGLFFLMLLAGIDVDPADIAKNSRAGIAVAIGGAALPLIGGFWLTWAVLPDEPERGALALFVGIALSTTAVPVIVKILLDLDLLHGRVGQTILDAAIFDDITGLLLLAILIGVLGDGALPQPADLLLLAGQVVAFFAITGFVGWYVLPIIERRIPRLHMPEVAFSRLILMALAFGLLGEALGLHFLLGPFMAGVMFRRPEVPKAPFQTTHTAIQTFTLAFLAPVFFASLGLKLDMSAVFAIPGFLVLLVAIAMLGKLVGAAVPAHYMGFSPRNSAAIGVAMSARGVISLVVCDIAYNAGLFTDLGDNPIAQHLFSAVVLTAIITTILSPILLRQVLGKARMAATKNPR